LDVSDNPLWLVFLGTAVLIVLAIEVGFRIGAVVQRKTEEKESPVSAIAGTMLALLAFMLAFTFGIVSDRFDARKALVREQAITISTSYARTDFLPEPDRGEAQALFATYLATLLAAADIENIDQQPALIAEARSILEQLWDMGVEQARLDSGSEMMALYIDSLNSVGDVQDLRIAIAVQARLADGIWIALFVLLVLAMVAVGYQTAIARSRRSWVLLLLVLSFSTVVTVIAVLDNPESGYLQVSQQPLIDVQQSMDEGASP